MIFYKQIANRDDLKFNRVARKVLGAEYGNCCYEAEAAFIEGYQSGTVTTRENCARRAANLVILRWLRDFGISNWQDLDAPQVKREVVKSNFASDKVKQRKFNSECGLWSKKF